jgi:hypothetical protein
MTIKSLTIAVTATCFLLIATRTPLWSAPRESKTPSKQPSCAAPEYRQFDFWVGDWDVFEQNSRTKVAHVPVDRILDGCALLGNYEGQSGLHGQSLSAYDMSRNAWQQTWVSMSKP